MQEAELNIIHNNTAEMLLEIQAVRLRPSNPFTWASGLRSPIYCDNRLIQDYVKERNMTISYGETFIDNYFPNTNKLASIATAGIWSGSMLSDRLELPHAYVRSKTKEHGRQNQIEGKINPGDRVVVVEDLISTGGSTLRAVEIENQYI